MRSEWITVIQQYKPNQPRLQVVHGLDTGNASRSWEGQSGGPSSGRVGRQVFIPTLTRLGFTLFESAKEVHASKFWQTMLTRPWSCID